MGEPVEGLADIVIDLLQAYRDVQRRHGYGGGHGSARYGCYVCVGKRGTKSWVLLVQGTGPSRW